MSPGLGDDHTIALNLVNEPMLLIDALRPPAGQLAAQKLRLARAAERITPCFLDQSQQTFRQLRICLNPILEILEGLRLRPFLKSLFVYRRGEMVLRPQRGQR